MRYLWYAALVLVVAVWASSLLAKAEKALERCIRLHRFDSRDEE